MYRLKTETAARVVSMIFGLALAANAGTFTITFDAGDPIGGLPVGSTLGAQYAAITGATFTPNGFTGAGGPTGSWGSNTNMTVVASGGGDVGGLGTPSLVSGNLLRSFNGWLSENGDPSFAITFATPITDFSLDFAGVATPSSSRIFAYNGSTLLTTVTSSTPTGQQHLSISGVGEITTIRVTPGDFFDWVGVDNISFTTADVTAAPEPSTFGMLGSGLIVAVAALRRRR